MTMRTVASVLAGYLLLGPAAADWQFRSRTDLAPPRLNITIPATKDVEKGYLFVAPFAGYPDTPTEQHGPRQAGPYIFRDNGDLVWSGYGIYSIWSTNFQAARWKGKDVLFSFEGDHNAGYGHGHGHITIMDQHYETIRELRAGSHKLVDKHEFHVINEETGLIQIYQPVPRDLTAWGGSSEQQWIVDAIIQGKPLSNLSTALFHRLTKPLPRTRHRHRRPPLRVAQSRPRHPCGGRPPPQPRPSRLGLQLVRRLGLLPHQQRRQGLGRQLPHLGP